MQLQKVTVGGVLVDHMKKTPEHADESVPQTVTELIKVHNGQETIQIGFTDQKISSHAGLSAFASFLHWHRFRAVLKGCLPTRTSPNATAAEDLGLGFITGVLAGAKKLAQVAHLRRDPLLPGLLGIEGVGSQSAFSRFFKSFKSAPENSQRFGLLWRWCVERLAARREGYTLDLDSTQLLHEEGHQKEGVRTGHTARGMKRCYHPLLAMLAEAKLVVGFWLRPGNSRCDTNVLAFTQELLGRLPRWLRVGLVRADSGFCYNPWLELLEARSLPYIVVGRIYQPVHGLIRRTTRWQPTELVGTEVAEEVYEGWDWSKPRRVVLLRHLQTERPEAGGKVLLDCPGYVHQVLVTNLPLEVSALEVWRRYNPRAGSENIIRELNESFALPQLSLKKFYATEAALSLAVLSYNLCVLFQRHLGWTQRVTAATLRFLIFTTGGVISRSGGYTTIRLAVPEGSHRWWWARILEKLTCPFRNCVAVEQLQPNWPG